MSIWSAILVTAAVLVTALLSEPMAEQRTVGADLGALQTLHAGSFR